MKKILLALALLLVALSGATVQAQTPTPNCGDRNKYPLGCGIPIVPLLKLTATQVENSIHLEWDLQPNVKTYYVWRYSEGTLKLLGSTKFGFLSDNDLECNRSYTYEIALDNPFQSGDNQKITTKFRCEKPSPEYEGVPVRGVMSDEQLTLSLVMVMLSCITLVIGVVVVLGIVWFATHRIPSTKDEIAKGNLFRITGSVERDEKGTFVRLSWMRAKSPNLKLRYQITRNPRFPLSAEIGKGQIEWLTVQECEYKDYDVMFGQTYEYRVIEPAWQQASSGSYATIQETRSMPFRIKVQ